MLSARTAEILRCPESKITHVWHLATHQTGDVGERDQAATDDESDSGPQVQGSGP